jgi:hypothetical protein
MKGAIVRVRNVRRKRLLENVDCLPHLMRRGKLTRMHRNRRKKRKNLLHLLLQLVLQSKVLLEERREGVLLLPLNKAQELTQLRRQNRKKTMWCMVPHLRLLRPA